MDTLAIPRIAAKNVSPRASEQRVDRAFRAGGWPIVAAELLVGEPHETSEHGGPAQAVHRQADELLLPLANTGSCAQWR
jgi:hypothetical protein